MAECHITEDLSLLLHRGDTLQSHITLPCYKGPHTMTGTFVVSMFVEKQK